MIDTPLRTDRYPRIEIFLISVFFSQVLHHTSVTAKPPSSSKVTTLSAVESSWDWRQLKLSLSGEVKFTQGDLSLSCDRAEIFFHRLSSIADTGTENTGTENTVRDEKLIPWADDRVELLSIKAIGSVHLTYRSLQLKTSEITYHHHKRQIKALGEVKGSWGTHRLGGRDLFIDLDQGVSSIHSIRLRFTEDSLPSSMKSLFGR